MLQHKSVIESLCMYEAIWAYRIKSLCSNERKLVLIGLVMTSHLTHLNSSIVKFIFQVCLGMTYFPPVVKTMVRDLLSCTIEISGSFNFKEMFFL